MFKPLNQPRLSPSPVPKSPRFQQYQYGPSSPRNFTSTASRRLSVPPASSSPIPAPPPNLSRQVKYVSRGTQYSPMIRKMADPPPPEPPLIKLAQPPQEDKRTSDDTAPQPTFQSKPILVADSPSLKKRHSRDEPSSTVNGAHTLAPKRVRSAQAPVKVLPAKYEFCEVEDMVIIIASMISELISTNDELPLRTGVLTRFHSRTPPGISVLDYLQRLAKHATLTPPLLLSMVYYIDRLCSLYPAFTINTLTVHRFLITAATVAAKGLSDSFWNNATYARVGGIKIAELGLLELDFLYRVDWKIVPNPEVLVDYYKGLVERSDNYEIEGDGSSQEDNDINSEEIETEVNPQSKTEEQNDVKWKEWMDDVSTQKSSAVKEEVSSEKEPSMMEEPSMKRESSAKEDLFVKEEVFD